MSVTLAWHTQGRARLPTASLIKSTRARTRKGSPFCTGYTTWAGKPCALHCGKSRTSLPSAKSSATSQPGRGDTPSPSSAASRSPVTPSAVSTGLTAGFVPRPIHETGGMLRAPPKTSVPSVSHGQLAISFGFSGGCPCAKNAGATTGYRRVTPKGRAITVSSATVPATTPASQPLQACAGAGLNK